jgi:hypothetical protein
MLVLALAEGNVGTMFRHRDMLVVFVAVLAGPSLAVVWARVALGVSRWLG